MGPSGSGKTTLLSSLAQRLDTYRMSLSGNLGMNGKKYTKHDLKAMSAYVMQDDLLNAHFTVEETLSYTAKLRMSPTSTTVERENRIKHVMKLVGIYHCKSVLVGDTRRKVSIQIITIMLLLILILLVITIIKLISTIINL